MPNTLDIAFSIPCAELIPYSRKVLLFGVQKIIAAEYGSALLMSHQDLNMEVEALIHSGHDEKDLYVQFQIGEKGSNAINPESLIMMGTDCKKKLVSTYGPSVIALGKLRRCSDRVEKVEL
ncbi:MAG: hypothetical protein ACREAO_00030 [Nitrososphaera sp.]